MANSANRFSRVLIAGVVGTFFCLAQLSLAAPIDEASSTNKKPAPNGSEPKPLVAKQLQGGDAAAARLALPAIERGVRALQAGDMATCLSEFDAAHDENPIVPPPLIMLAQVYLLNRQPREAVEALEQAAVQSSDHPELYLLCAQLALAEGRNMDAWVHFDRALNLETRPKWPATYAKDFEATCYFGMATIAERRQDWRVAEAAYREWNKIDPDNAHVLDGWGKAFFLLDSEEEALARFTRAHQADASINPAEVSMGAMATSAGRFDDAQGWYAKAKQKYPRDGSVLFEYGVSLLMAGQFADARAAFDEALEIGTKLDRYGAAVPLMQGYAAAGAKDYAAAESLFTKALEASPGQFEALRHLSLALVEQKDEEKSDRALQLASALASNYPQSASAQATLAWIQFRLGEADDAEKSLTKGDFANADADALFAAAQILVARGKAAAAGSMVGAIDEATRAPALFIGRDSARQWLKTTALLFPKHAPQP